MRYISTRGQAEPRLFSDIILSPLAPDGGLYMPTYWPQIEAQTLAAFRDRPFAAVAAHIFSLFDDEMDEAAWRALCEKAYGHFSHPQVTPLRTLSEGLHLLELFHGPTLAFKDIALQILGPIIERKLHQRGERLCIIAATSGDTGAAAIKALAGREAVDLFILHPKGAISAIQRRMMSVCQAENVFNIAIDGSFDDCQSMVKAMFGDEVFSQELNLGAINSINWARIVAQMVYYFTSAVALGAPEKRLAYSVPTGNFGDVFAGAAAQKMGLPISMLAIASNENDILTRTLSSGAHRLEAVRKTLSPAMDIQISSNFERALFELSGRDGVLVSRLMEDLSKTGQYHLSPEMLSSLRDTFFAHAVDDHATSAMMAQCLQEYDMLIDPHSAVGLVAAQKMRETGLVVDHLISLATAHPAKFPETVLKATGRKAPLPEAMKAIEDLPERLDALPNDLDRVKKYIKARTRATKE